MEKIKETTQRGVAKVGQFGTDVAAKTRRYWRCLTKLDKYGCSAEERQKARKWLIYTPTAIVVSLLTAAGIAAGAYIVQKKKEEEDPETTQKITDLTQLVNLKYNSYKNYWGALQAFDYISEDHLKEFKELLDNALRRITVIIKINLKDTC